MESECSKTIGDTTAERTERYTSLQLMHLLRAGEKIFQGDGSNCCTVVCWAGVNDVMPAVRQSIVGLQTEIEWTRS
jgi:hypothetical protein